MRLLLTDRFCASAKTKDAVQTDYFDETVSGLALRVSSGGRKTWTFNFSDQNGKRARSSIGSYPATSLAEARTRALEARGHLEAGEDPRRAFNAQAAGEVTLGSLIGSFLQKHAKPNLRSAPAIERRLQKNVVAVIGKVRLADIHRRDINRAVDAIAERGSLIEANRTFEDLRAVLRWAVARGDLDGNPMEGMNKPAAPRSRERVLSDEEVHTLWNVLPTALRRSVAVQRIIRLCLVTGQRVGEVAGMRLDELDMKGRIWSLPGSRTKNGHPHAVPLSALALEIIHEAWAEAGQGTAFVFPSSNGSLPPHAAAVTIVRAQARFGIQPWSAHDLRRTALTGMAALGVAPIVLGHVANHRTTTKAGVTLATYSKYTYEGEKRHALDLWAAKLSGMVDSKTAEIIPLRASA